MYRTKADLPTDIRQNDLDYDAAVGIAGTQSVKYTSKMHVRLMTDTTSRTICTTLCKNESSAAAPQWELEKG